MSSILHEEKSEGMGEIWKRLFSEYPILQSSIICKEVSITLEGNRTYHHELHKLHETELDRFVLVQVWRGNHSNPCTFYEVIELVGVDGEVLACSSSEPFSIYSVSQRHYNYFSFAQFKFPKKGIYEFRSKLYRVHEKETTCLHENYLVVL